jgi:hypothetical protein
VMTTQWATSTGPSPDSLSLTNLVVRSSPRKRTAFAADERRPPEVERGARADGVGDGLRVDRGSAPPPQGQGSGRRSVADNARFGEQ